MYKNILTVVGITILILGTFITPSVANDNVKKSTYTIGTGNTLYVGGSGPNNYTRIQYAIDDASDGDTVFVYEGTYYEQIYINTTISLIGENKVTTIINGSEIGTVVTINADYVNINDFKIEKSSMYDNGIEVNSDYNDISDNIFDENGYGIHIEDADNHTITGNIFHYHRWGCIRTENSNNNIITGNSFIDTQYGGISISYSDFSIISDNQITWVRDNGISTGWCNYLEITNNTLIGEDKSRGISLYYTDNCTISGNIINSWDRGIWLEYSNHNKLYGNENTNCDYYGIFFYSNSNYNVISNNILSNNEESGITMQDFSSNNIIYSNTISSNSFGINIRYQTNCNDNNIYHNNLINNNVNAFDGCSNIWNISYPSGGNYWSDYTGDDNNRGPNQDTSGSDGIGDTTLNISGGGGNKDFYPFMYPWGEQRPVANYTLFEEYGGYVFNASTSYDRDGKVVSFEWDFGDGATDSGMVVAHSYNESGPYDVTLSVTDDEGYKGNITKTIDANKNYPPEIPSIEGPSSGKWGKPHHFTFQTTDIEGSNVWYYVDWGDGSDTGWMGPFVSGDEVSEPHTWIDQETYVVRCKAKDMYSIQSDWAEHEITIPRPRTSSFLWYEWLIERFPLLERLLTLLLL